LPVPFRKKLGSGLAIKQKLGAPTAKCLQDLTPWFDLQEIAVYFGVHCATVSRAVKGAEQRCVHACKT